MKDFLDREVKDGDLCVGMAIGRDSSGMHVGICKGKSIVILVYDDIKKVSPRNIYLIENPTKKEIEIKDKILFLLNKEEQERKQKKKEKTIPLSELEIGGIYESTSGLRFLYLGNKTLTYEFGYINGSLYDEKETGNLFVDVYDYDYKTFSIEELRDLLIDNTLYYGKPNVDVLKRNKKLVKLLRKIDLEFPIFANGENYNRYSHCSITVQ